MHTTAEKPQRADARRNREAILTAAKAVFARCGSEAQMDDIARRAKLGVGTLYRHFPTKNALIEALVADRFHQITGFVADGLQDPDPYRGLCTAMHRGAELAARDRGVSSLFGDVGESAAVREAQGQALELMSELIARGQAAGTLRPGFTAQDIPNVMCGVVSAMHTIGDGGWERHLQLILDGMRARPDLEPLPPRSV